jgi:UDP-2,3-diacylglucosamine pyrophosphatase LpxH
MTLTTSPNLSHHYRSLFISDLHLGAKACRSDRILDFLKWNTAETIYLVGDVFDNPRISGLGNTMADDAVVKSLIAKASNGQRIVYIAGNHDNLSRQACSNFLGSVEILDWLIHLTADGQRFLVIHGDCFDMVVQHAKWLTTLGRHIDHAIRHLNDILNRARRSRGMHDWSMMKTITARMNFLVTRGEPFTRRVTVLVDEHAANGIICGHFHSPEIHQKFGIVYANCGDWLDNCTAIGENDDGQLHVLSWTTPDVQPAKMQVQSVTEAVHGLRA